MTRVIFIERDGATREVEARPGDRLLDLAQNAGEPLEGTCEGQMACSTCHVIVDAQDFAKLPPPSRRKRTCSTSPREPRGTADLPAKSG